METISISKLKKYPYLSKEISNKSIYDIGELPHGNYFYKYIDLESVLLSLHNDEGRSTLRFVEPTAWDDEYEGRFYTADYKNVDPNGEKSPCLYACCMTTKSDNEAAWHIYTHGKTGLASRCVEFTINRKKIREEIMKNYQDGSVYIGCVQYKSKVVIDNIHNKFFKQGFSIAGKGSERNKITYTPNQDYLEFFNDFNLDNYLNLLLLKRPAYEHEQEVRLFILPKKNEDKYLGKRISEKMGMKEAKAKSLFINIDWINVLEGVSIDKNCSPFEKKLLQNHIDKLLKKKENDLGSLYEDKYKKLRVQYINVYEDNRNNRIVIEKP